MNKAQLSKAIASKTQLSERDAAAALDAALEAIAGALERGEAITLRGFGTISAKRKPPRAARGFAPAAPERIAVTLNASALEERLNASGNPDR